MIEEQLGGSMAKHMLCILPRWSARLFSVELKETSVYFGLSEKKQQKDFGHQEVPSVFSDQQGHRFYSLLVSTTDRILRARFLSQLRDRLLQDLSTDCHVFPMSSFLPNVQGSVISGFLLKERSERGPLTEGLLRNYAQHHPVLVCSYSPDQDAPSSIQRWTQHLWSSEEKGYRVVSVEEPPYHPSILNIFNSQVFYSVEEAAQVLKQCSDVIPEASSVLQVLTEHRVKRTHGSVFSVIVVEGLDATGKTTLTESLRDTLGATLLRSPPHCLSPWRSRFDEEPPLIRRAFYAVGNYITAELIQQEAMKGPVIVDRFWHSTAAYAIATAVSGPTCNLPEVGSDLYVWPPDLLQPSLVVLLSVDPEERTRRLRTRGQGKTDEEQKLDQNQLFRLRVEAAYQRIRGPACVSVDAGPSAEEVLQQVLLLIHNKCHV